jgi:hypothetical protein
MAVKAIDKSVAEAILVDWRVGQLSQQQIAEKNKVSKGLVNKLCKSVEQVGSAIVAAFISSKTQQKKQHLIAEKTQTGHRISVVTKQKATPKRLFFAYSPL